MLAILATGLVVCFHVRFWLCAGGLWRDEVASVELAQQPSWAQLWRNLPFDSFPILWPAVLRGWAGVGLTSDAGLRALGALSGLGILAALWFNARRLGYRLPFLAIVLLGFNAAVIGFGDTLRGYGLGMCLGLLTFGLLWRLTESRSMWAIVVAAISAVLSVHMVYYNAVFLLASGCGAAVVLARRRLWRRALIPIAIGLLAAGSLLIYIPVFRDVHEWSIALQRPLDLAGIFDRFHSTLALTGAVIPWVWLALTVLAAGVAIRIQFAPREFVPRERDVALFAGTALVFGLVGYVLFLFELGYDMKPWYYLVLMALVAACVEPVLAIWSKTPARRMLHGGLIIVVAALGLVPTWRIAGERRTNVDLVAADLEISADDGDLILLNPWYNGISFQRYYHGKATWLTIPPMEHPKPGRQTPSLLHRYDLMKRAMMTPHPLQPLWSQVAAVLQGGKRVWVVGSFTLKQATGELPPAPAPGVGWNDSVYGAEWTMQLGHVLQMNAARIGLVPMELAQPVSSYENLPLYVSEGSRQAAGR